MSAIYVLGDVYTENELIVPDHTLLLHFEDYKRYCENNNKEITDKAILNLGFTKRKIAWLKFHQKF